MNKLMEYMALGKPTVAFDLVETRYSAAGAAILVQPNDVLEFARQVVRLMGDSAERRRLGEIGRQRIAVQLAWEYSVPQLISAYCDGMSLAPATNRLVGSQQTSERRESR